jgi:hypothetical protein
MHGIEPEELLLLSPAEHKKVFGKGVSAEVAAQYYSVYCIKRDDSFRRVLQQRERLLHSSTHHRLTETSKSPLRGSSVDQQLAKQRELERVERKQQIELKKLVEKEIEREQMEERKTQLDVKAREREQARLAALSAKQKEIEDKRLHDDEKRRQKAQFEEEQKRLRAAIEIEKERKRMEEESERNKARLKEANAKEEQRRQKRLVKELIAAKTLEEQKLNAKQRAAELAERERKRKEKAEEQAKMKANENKLSSEQKIAKLSAVRYVMEQQLLDKHQSLTEKQRQTEEKRRQFELKRTQQLERARLRAEKKEEEIRRIRLTNELLEEKRREEFSINMSKAEVRHMEQLAQLEAKLKEKQLKAFEKQCRIEMLQANLGQIQSLKSEQILEKQAKKDEMVEAVKHKLKADRQNKIEFAKLKEQDSQLARQRQAKMEDYRRSLVKDKLTEENERIRQLKKQKKALQAEKLTLRAQVEAKKAQILESFGKMKQSPGKLDKADILSTLDMTSMSSTLPRTRSPKTRSNEYQGAWMEVEALKQTQAEELLALIQTEQAKESQREQDLREAPKERHAELELSFGQQRAEASHRIESLAA